MKRSIIPSLILVTLFLIGQALTGQTKAGSAYEKMKMLEGEWQGTSSDGSPITVSYKVMSAGSALVETLEPPMGESSMVTVYHLDGDNLMMTHYCSAQNQPRMRAKPVSGDVEKIDFSFIDATSLAKPTDGHMHKLVVTFVDNAHFTQQWTFAQEGKEKPETFSFERKK